MTPSLPPSSPAPSERRSARPTPRLSRPASGVDGPASAADFAALPDADATPHEAHSQSPSQTMTICIVPDISRAEGISRFDMREELGRGGLAVVRIATDLRLYREVAIKRLQRADDPHARMKFLEEAQITGQLQHPNIVPIYDFGEDVDGRLYLAMKPIKGKTFEQMIAWRLKSRPTKPDPRTRQKLRRVLGVFSKICDAVAFAHSRGVVHRDLKPTNVLVGEFGEVQVIDWGLAKPLSRDGSGGESAVITDRRLDGDSTLAGEILGTPGFMAPEQAGGFAGTVDEGADIYALGAMLYAILTGKLPVQGDSEMELLSATLENAIAPPARRAPDLWIPAELDAVAMKAMARRRKDRFATVTELQAEIENFLDGATKPATVSAIPAASQSQPHSTSAPTVVRPLLAWFGAVWWRGIAASATALGVMALAMAVVVASYEGRIGELERENHRIAATAHAPPTDSPTPMPTPNSPPIERQVETPTPSAQPTTNAAANSNPGPENSNAHANPPIDLRPPPENQPAANFRPRVGGRRNVPAANAPANRPPVPPDSGPEAVRVRVFGMPEFEAKRLLIAIYEGEGMNAVPQTVPAEMAHLDGTIKLWEICRMHALQASNTYGRTMGGRFFLMLASNEHPTRANGMSMFAASQLARMGRPGVPAVGVHEFLEKMHAVFGCDTVVLVADAADILKDLTSRAGAVAVPAGMTLHVVHMGPPNTTAEMVAQNLATVGGGTFARIVGQAPADD